MTTYVALLRAVNVLGSGSLPMAELVAMCGRTGFANARTYIASGNVVFACRLSEKGVKQRLEAELARYAGRPMAVMVRTGPELAAVLKNNPFPKAAPNRTVAIFLDTAPSPAMLQVRGQNGEEVRLGAREIYVHYVNGIGVSKLKIPGADVGTMRNMNTIAKLVEMAAAL